MAENIHDQLARMEQKLDVLVARGGTPVPDPDPVDPVDPVDPTDPVDPGDTGNEDWDNPPEPPDHEDGPDTPDVPVDPEDPPVDPPVTPGTPISKKPVDVVPLIGQWTLMQPTGPAQGDPDNDYPAKLKDGVIPDTFYAAKDSGGDHVVYKVYPAKAIHSPNSKYGRCESREMVAGQNWKNGAWPSSGPRKLTARLAIDTSKLVTRKRCNGLQIHDGGDDVMQVMKHETNGLGVMYKDGQAWLELDKNYVDGTPFDCTIDVVSDKVTVTYNGSKSVSFTQKGTGWYWKAGCYAQTGGASTFVEPDSAYVIVKLYSLSATS